jgi:hypothetical protein
LRFSLEATSNPTEQFLVLDQKTGRKFYVSGEESTSAKPNIPDLPGSSVPA